MDTERMSRDRPGRNTTGMEPGSGRGTGSNLGKKLNTEGKAKAAAGAKLRSENSAQKAAGEKMRFDKAVFEAEPEGAAKGSSPAARRLKQSGGKKPKASHAVRQLSEGKLHHEISEQNGDNNIGVDAANAGSQAAETAAEYAGDTASNAFSRWRQKQGIKSEYAAAKAGRTTGEAAGTAAGAGHAAGNAGGGTAAKGAGKAAKETKNVMEKMAEFVSAHSHMILMLGGLLLVIMVVTGMMGSCSVFFQSGTNVVIDTSYTADDADILGAEADYCALESALQDRIDNIRTEYDGYDEYNISTDQIGHNPYELASYLTILFENYTRAQVQDTLQELFDSQYDLDIEEVVEIRTRTESREVEHSETDPETGEEDSWTETEYYEVEYEYYILNVTLKNNGLGKVITESGITEDQMQRYAVLMQTYGNKKELFGDSPYAIVAQEVLHYDIPGEALTDERFRRMITEAEKYLGYPYVWGGASPSTSFDCSGFVSWVINHCGNGWSYGRLTAEGLRQVCAIIPKSEAKPGDLIFFQGTYNTSGASHVGIYVGNGMMIHCGNPIQYASTETSYWQAHYLCCGRLP